MLGMDLQAVLHDRDFIALGREDVDITNVEAVKTEILNAEPDVVINATGYNDANKAESEPGVANLINGHAVGQMAKICRDFGIIFVHFSTDYVFDGKNIDGYKEDAQPSPLSAYGRSKLLGEELMIEAMEAEFEGKEIEEGKYYLIRTSYLFGKHRLNLLTKLLNNAKKDVPFKVITDQISCPTFTMDLARQVKWLVESNEYESGIYHITNSGPTNWYDLAKTLVVDAGMDAGLVQPCSYKEWVAPAERPQYSVLINTKLPQLRHWKEALKDFLG